MEKPFKLTFSNELTASAIRVHHSTELFVALCNLGFYHPNSTLVLVGGAGQVGDADMARLRPLFVEVLAPLAEILGASVVDGGTDSGVMRLMGQARAKTGATFPLIGVAAEETVTFPGATHSTHPFPSKEGRKGWVETAPLEPHHTHFVIVPGCDWGDESPWIARVASVLANRRPSVTVLVNGGEIALEDVSQSVKACRTVVVVSGSGRMADTLAAALRGETADGRAKALADSGLLRTIDLTADSDALAKMLEEILSVKV